MNNEISFTFKDLDDWYVEIQPYEEKYLGHIYNNGNFYDCVKGTLDYCVKRSREIIENVIKIIPKHLINNKEIFTIIKNDGSFGNPIFHVLVKANGRASVNIFKMNNNITKEYDYISRYIDSRKQEE